MDDTDPTQALYRLAGWVPPRTPWLNRLFGVTPEMPATPPAAGNYPSPGLTGPVPTSLHDYPTMAARPLSPNLVDLRAQQQQNPIWEMFRRMFPQGGPGQGNTPAGPQVPLINWSRIDPSTWYLSNTPEQAQAPPTSTSTTLPQQTGLGAAFGGEMPPTGTGALPTATTDDEGMPVTSRHQQFAEMRNLYRQLRPGAGVPDEALYPLLQHLWNLGTIYDEGGYGQGMSATVPFFDPQGRIMHLFDRYHDYLNQGNPPAPPQGVLGTLPPG